MRKTAWSVAQLRSNQFAVAGENLRDQGLPVYDPKTSERVRGGWRRVQLFVNYLFVGNVAGFERAINSTKGVLRLLPGLLPDGFVEALRSMETRHGTILVRDFREGQDVFVTSRDDEFVKVPAKFVRYKSSDRVVVLLSLLGKRAEVEFKKGELVAA